jgi:8-oxo-dGTP diphosphatase
MNNEMTHDDRPAVASAVITHKGAVLLVRRRVKEGDLSWQFPGGAVEQGETAGQAATRETREETGLSVAESKVLGERIHPNTGRLMIYVACEVTEGEASVVDDDELDSIAWVRRANLAEYVPYGFYEPVQAHLDTVLQDI